MIMAWRVGHAVSSQDSIRAEAHTHFAFAGCRVMWQWGTFAGELETQSLVLPAGGVVAVGDPQFDGPGPLVFGLLDGGERQLCTDAATTLGRDNPHADHLGLAPAGLVESSHPDTVTGVATCHEPGHRVEERQPFLPVVAAFVG